MKVDSAIVVYYDRDQIVLYSILGQQVGILENEIKSVGMHTLASGSYWGTIDLICLTTISWSVRIIGFVFDFKRIFQQIRLIEIERFDCNQLIFYTLSRLSELLP